VDKKPVNARLPPSRRKRRLFILLCIGLPLLALAGAEGVLRLFGWGGYPPFLRAVGPLPSGETLCIVEPAASQPYFFANPKRPGFAWQSCLVMPKPQDTVRVFLIGESAAKGYPQPRNLSMAAFLETMLADLWPGRRAEVLNLGTTAVASFPLVYLVRDALAYDPDLLIFYLGNNEFFGAYGTGSIDSAGVLSPSVMRVLRATRGLALVQALSRWIHGRVQEDRTLMEEMMGAASIPPQSSLRDAAARNLTENLGAMLDEARAADVPVLVCTTASNESGLAPLGSDEVDEAPVPQQARAQFLLGRARAEAGDRAGAREAFLAARDLDSLPWRPTSELEEAIRATARARGAVLCDIAEIFRRESVDGATGWEWMDDHVHLSLKGQARAARAMAESMTLLPEPLRVDSNRLAALPDADTLAARLGANRYDEYGVHHTLRILFGVDFMKRASPEALARHEQACREAEDSMSSGLRAAAREWQGLRPQAGAQRPLTALAARALLRENKTTEALPLYEIAARQVPLYTSWHIEYVYFRLACREKLSGKLNEADRAAAAEALAEGRFLLQHGESGSGFTERYMGRLHQLRGEWAEAIPWLLAARPRMQAEDRVACDQALLLSYLKTGQPAEALAVIDAGLRNNPTFARLYRNMRGEIERSRESGSDHGK
jgi:hypothetical protein